MITTKTKSLKPRKTKSKIKTTLTDKEYRLRRAKIASDTKKAKYAMKAKQGIVKDIGDATAKTVASLGGVSLLNEREKRKSQEVSNAGYDALRAWLDAGDKSTGKNQSQNTGDLDSSALGG